MSHVELTSRYLDALNHGSLESVLELFTPDAVVHSPLYGEMTAKLFYTGLFADTSRSQTELIEVYPSGEAGRSLALHFKYKWTLKNGRDVDFECVDIFEICTGSDRFSGLKIIYDTHPIRDEFEQSTKTAVTAAAGSTPGPGAPTA